MPVEHRSRNDLPYLFSPASTTADQSAPLVLFLHGSRDRGTDLNTLLRRGLPRFVNESSFLPYAFVAPQISEEQTWADRSSDVIALLDELLVTQSIDPTRVIITGFSLGAAGTWHLATSYPDRFAGLVAVSGRVPKAFGESEIASLKKIPIQIFQGGKDANIPVENVEQFAITLKELGATVSLTVFLEADHFIADQVYGAPELQQWFVTQHRDKSAIAV